MSPRIRIISLVCILGSPFASHGADGIWTLDGNGNWSSTGNWAGGTIASGANAIANFANLNITADRTVTVDSPYTADTLIFGDTSARHRRGVPVAAGRSPHVGLTTSLVQNPGPFRRT